MENSYRTTGSLWIPDTEEDLVAHAAWLRFTGTAVPTITVKYSRELKETVRKYVACRSVADYNRICHLVDQACGIKLQKFCITFRS